MVCKKEAELQSQIAELKKQKEQVKGTECSVYSRVVGYLRPVENWNKGKKEEYKMRKMFKMDLEKSCCHSHD